MQKLKRYTMTLLGCSLITIGGLALYEFSQPSLGSIQTSKNLNSVKGATIQMKTHELQLLSLKLNDTYIKRKSDESLNGPIFGQYVFLDSSSSLAPQVAITVGELDGASVKDVPFAKQRLLDPSRYEILSEESTKLEIISVAENECAIFLTHKTYYTAIVMQAGKLTSGQLCNEAKSVVSTISWN